VFLDQLVFQSVGIVGHQRHPMTGSIAVDALVIAVEMIEESLADVAFANVNPHGPEEEAVASVLAGRERLNIRS